MKTRQYIALITFITLFVFATNAQNQTSTIEIHITDIQSAEGTIRIGLYNSESNFYKQIFRSVAIKAKKGALKITLNDIPYGEYAISLYHDENNNKKLDSNFFKIPKEPYGTSNNAKGSFGPPKWEDAKFSVSEQIVNQSIEL
ncbi:DUF2141 domain-containing protein [Aquimarina sp. MMG016]|uniref:DUF2141 domain-containing protein n=1 Tax=Aquimarina sp. MMG016 TaxID=2822690 RepID=UPI001B3A4AB6|nr:DUF2141 domain-containing protein [Aquimarina sp. MMG016]MBQ4822388.1 DUF2141 domain-containing protein [Aquimarina sp. MMG016]